jgi:hypothetical protein
MPRVLGRATCISNVSSRTLHNFVKGYGTRRKRIEVVIRVGQFLAIFIRHSLGASAV